MTLLSAKLRVSGDEGQSLVEFGLVAFLLVMLLLAFIEIGRMVLVYTAVANAARAGVRYAIVHGSDNVATKDDIKTVVKGFLSSAPVNLANAGLAIDVDYPACSDPGCKVTVTATYPYDPLISYFPWPAINLRSTSQGVITF